MANLKHISSFIIFGQTQGIKWIVPSDFLAKKEQFSIHEDLQPIADSIKKGPSITKVNHCANAPYCQIKTSIEKSIAVFNSTASKVFSFFFHFSYSISQRSRAHNNIARMCCLLV